MGSEEHSEAILYYRNLVMKKLKEHFVHKDGIWLVPFSHLNADAVRVEVWIDDKRVNEQEYVYGYTDGKDPVKLALEFAHELSKSENLPIIDGSGVEYFTFPQEYRRTDYRTHNSWKPVVDDPTVEEYKYTDQELDDMDERERHTVKWAICKGPNLFTIYDNITKNPGRMWDTEMFRGMCGDEGDVVGDFKKFFEKNADKVYEGTWEDIKDGEYVVIVNGRRYTSKSIKKTFDAIISAGLKINGDRIEGEVHTGEYKDVKDYDSFGEYNHKEEIVISFNHIPKFDTAWSSDRSERINSTLKKYTQVYDALTCAGVFFPEEFRIEYRESDMAPVEKTYVFQIDDDHVLHVGDEEKLENFKTLQVGDVVSMRQTGTFNEERLHPLYYVVVEKGKKSAKIARVSTKLQTSDSPWGYSEYDYTTIISPRYYEDALNGKYTTDYVWNGYSHQKRDDVKTINLLDNNCTIRYRAGSKELMDQFRSAMYTCGEFGRARYYYKNTDLLKEHAPHNPEEFFGEPLLYVTMDDYHLKHYQAKQKYGPEMEATMESFMERSGFKFSGKNNDEDNRDRYFVRYNKGKDSFTFRFDKWSLEYKISAEVNDQWYKYGGDNFPEFEKDMTEIFEKVGL